MKILIISGIFPPDIGGPATFTSMMASELVQRGHKVSVISLRDKKNIRVKSSFKIYTLNRNLFHPIRFFLTTILIVSCSMKKDAIICTGLHEETGLALKVSRKSSIARVVGDPIWERMTNKMHNSESIYLLTDKKNTPFLYRFQRKLLTYCLNQFDLITCPSQELLDYLKKWGVLTDSIYLANGVNFSSENLERKKKYDFVTLSRLVEWKNVDLAIWIAQKTNRSLAIIGEGPELNKLKTLSKNNTRIEFLGSLDQEKSHEILRSSTSLLLLSSYEGMSFSMLEAMNAGTIVICSDIASNRNVIRDLENGVLVNLKKLDDELVKIEGILNDSETIKKIRINARETIKSDHNFIQQVLFFENKLMEIIQS